MSINDEKEIASIPSLNGENKFTEFVQWEIIENQYFAGRRTTKKVPPGYYTVIWNGTKGMYGLQKHDVVTEKVIGLPDKNLELILDDIKKFWASKEKYDKKEYVFKRGILMFGPPGCGKTSTIQLLCKELIEEHNGIIISITSVTDIHNFDFVINTFRRIEKNRKLIIIIEDIDNFVMENEVTTKLLNILDGNMRLNNVVTIATTNYPEKLQERISNRPSRFDRRYEITLPDPTVREFYIKSVLTDDELKSIDMISWIKDTEGFTLDHLKELILSVFVLCNEYKTAIEEIKNMMENGKIKPTPLKNSKKMGF